LSRDTENQPESETSTDGVQMPEPGQLELDMADGGLQMLVQGHREPA
jgi:hypothetical protein